MTKELDCRRTDVAAMEQTDLYGAIFKRKSIRKFDQSPLDADTLAKVSAFIRSVRPLFGDIKVELKILSDNDVRGSFMKVKAPHFIAAFSETKEGSLANVGFLLQQVDLFLSASGLGSVWQGNPKPSREITDASKLDFVIVMAFGRPAEPLHRENVSEFKREPIEKIRDFAGHDDLLEPARLAPSAINNQPWFFTGGEGTIDVYCATSMMVDKWNILAGGIAACHIWIAATHLGKGVDFVLDEAAGERAPSKHRYIVTLKIK